MLCGYPHFKMKERIYGGVRDAFTRRKTQGTPHPIEASGPRAGVGSGEYQELEVVNLGTACCAPVFICYSIFKNSPSCRAEVSAMMQAFATAKTSVVEMVFSRPLEKASIMVSTKTPLRSGGNSGW